MADSLTPAERSERMSRIRGKDTKPEILVRRFLHASGFRYRLHLAKLPGRPDIVLPRFKTIVLVNGCFWHGHSCQKGRIPGGSAFWKEKLERNRLRDARNARKLRQLGWRVLTIWECSLVTIGGRKAALSSLQRKIKTGSKSL